MSGPEAVPKLTSSCSVLGQLSLQAWGWGGSPGQCPAKGNTGDPGQLCAGEPFRLLAGETRAVGQDLAN